MNVTGVCFIENEGFEASSLGGTSNKIKRFIVFDHKHGEIDIKVVKNMKSCT